ncbi:hypothetical protein CCO03_14740 [Comamonas serinivorans]|uniref:TMEM205-like domain-containing protein n=1 Tax=Comamonas serinivorans TaxID=1082851 RepID=A0A1Y0EQ42_9BURK|nr:DUF4149 domain-containing protein [Comamonas serinivorans]ARU05774.1 hypothetical protein CCO03_14740 [Comamonas serinivorans]
MLNRLSLFVIAAWWASISALGFWIVPMLFAKLPTPAMAGTLAAQLFAQQSLVALACGVVLLLVNRRAAATRHGVPADPHARTTLVIVLVALFVVIANQYGVSPRIVARDNLKLWHSVGSALYLVQWLCVTALLWRHAGRPRWA